MKKLIKISCSHIIFYCSSTASWVFIMAEKITFGFFPQINAFRLHRLLTTFTFPRRNNLERKKQATLNKKNNIGSYIQHTLQKYPNYLLQKGLHYTMSPNIPNIVNKQ